MKELLLIAVGSALVNNVVLSQFLGICPFLGVSKKMSKNSSRYGRSRCLCYHDFFVCNGADLPVYFSAAAFRISADDCVYPCYCGTGAVCRNVSEKRQCRRCIRRWEFYLPLITTNCAVLGVALTNVQKSYSIGAGVVNGVATAVGFLIAIVLMAGIREKIEYNDVPESFQGTPIVLVTAGLMAIAFSDSRD